MQWNQSTQNWGTTTQPQPGGFGGQPQGHFPTGPQGWNASHTPNNQPSGAPPSHPQYAATVGCQPAQQRQQTQQSWGSGSLSMPFAPQSNSGQHAPTTGWGPQQQSPQGWPQNGQSTGNNMAPHSNGNGQWPAPQQFGQFGQSAQPPPQQHQQHQWTQPPTWSQPGAQAPPPPQQQQQQQWSSQPSNGPGASASWPPVNNNATPPGTNNSGWGPAKTRFDKQKQAFPAGHTTTSTPWGPDASAQRAAKCSPYTGH